MPAVVFRRLLQFTVLLLLAFVLIGHPPSAAAKPYCGDCPQAIPNTPDCPLNSACYGCWKNCVSDGGACPEINPSCSPNVFIVCRTYDEYVYFCWSA